MTIIVNECPFCGKVNEIHIDPNVYIEWKFNGRSIQNVAPYMSATEREMLISGICEKCQKEIFQEG